MTQRPAHASITDSFPADSKRGHERLLAYWQECSGARKFPQANEIDTKAIADLWASCFLLNTTQKDSTDYRYEFIGPSLIEAYGVDLTGQAHTKDTIPNILSILAAFSDMVKNGETAVDESEFTNANGAQVKYRCCLLPFGKAPDTVEYILGFMRWKTEPSAP